MSFPGNLTFSWEIFHSSTIAFGKFYPVNNKFALSANRLSSHAARVQLFYYAWSFFLSTALTAGHDEWLERNMSHSSLSIVEPLNSKRTPVIMSYPKVEPFYSKLITPSTNYSLLHKFSKCSVRSPRAPREKPPGSASYLFFFVFIFRNWLWGSVNYGQSLHRLHNTKSLRTHARLPPQITIA